MRLLLGVAACERGGFGEREPVAARVGRRRPDPDHRRLSAPAGVPDVAAVYFTVTDTSAETDTLLSAASAPSAQVTLMSETSSGNAESMSEITGGLLIPAHGSVALGPGGYHVMLTDPAVPLKQGGTVALTLTFRHAGKVVLDVPITSLLSDAQTGSGATDDATSMSGMPGM